MVVDGKSIEVQPPLQIGSLQLQQLALPPNSLRIMTPLLTLYISGIPAWHTSQMSGSLHVRVVADMRLLAGSTEQLSGLLSPTTNSLFLNEQVRPAPPELHSLPSRHT